MDSNGYQMPPMQAPPLMNPPPQIFGGYNADPLASINMSDLSQSIFADANLMDESVEAKRRRIARVRTVCAVRLCRPTDERVGLRYVPEEEDQVRWKATCLHAL